MSHEFNPEHDQTGIRITSAHIRNELDFILRMLAGMVMWFVGTVPKRLGGSIITAFPAVNVLSLVLCLVAAFVTPNLSVRKTISNRN